MTANEFLKEMQAAFGKDGIKAWRATHADGRIAQSPTWKREYGTSYDQVERDEFEQRDLL